MRVMRAKMQVQSVTRYANPAETIKMSAVCGKAPFGAAGESEDNTFARFTPSGTMELSITNPDLIGKITPGQKFSVDFHEATD